MNTREILAEWQAILKPATGHMSELVQLTGGDYSSPLLSAFEALCGYATRLAAEKAGCADEWLEVWRTEHNYGELPMKARLVGEPLREIRTIEELAELVLGDVAKS